MGAVSYDELWRGSWGDLQRVGPVHRHLREDLVRVVSALDVRTVLDVGCGSGDNLAALVAQGRHDRAGVDISPEALAIARARVPRARLSLLDVEQGALSERFDLAISIQVIEHLLDDVAALRHMAAMARGYVFVSTIQGRMRHSEAAIGHVRNYSVPELREKLARAGLEVLRISGWGFPFYSPLYRSLAEWLRGGPLYHLSRLNWPGRGDVLSALGRPA